MPLPKLYVLIIADGLAEIYEDIIRNTLGHRYNLNVTFFDYAEELIERTQPQSRGLVALTLNNVFFRDQRDVPPCDHLDRAVDVVRVLKTVDKLSVFVTSGWRDPDKGENVIKAGADAFFYLPFEIKDYQDRLEAVFL